MESDNSGNNEGQFAKQGGEALELDGDFNDSEEVDEEEENPNMMKPQKPEGSGGKPPGPGGKVDGKKLENQPYDLAVDVNDSEEIESDEEDDEVGEMNAGAGGAGASQQ